MNERIRQLYYECQDESQSTEQCYQRFAELIVKECIKLNGKELAMAGHSRMVDVYCEHFEIEF